MEGGSARIASLLFVFKTVRLEGKLRYNECTFAPINILRVNVDVHPEMNIILNIQLIAQCFIIKIH